MVLLYFFLGVLFIEMIIPVLESLTNVIVQGLEVIRGWFSVKVAKLSAEMTDIKSSYASDDIIKKIGFAYEEEEQEEEDEDE